MHEKPLTKREALPSMKVACVVSPPNSWVEGSKALNICRQHHMTPEKHSFLSILQKKKHSHIICNDPCGMCMGICMAWKIIISYLSTGFETTSSTIISSFQVHQVRLLGCPSQVSTTAIPVERKEALRRVGSDARGCVAVEAQSTLMS